MKELKWWIKERYNPQTGTYYVAYGQMSKAAAKRHEQTKYGENVMYPYETESEYKKKLDGLKKEGCTLVNRIMD